MSDMRGDIPCLCGSCVELERNSHVSRPDEAAHLDVISHSPLHRDAIPVWYGETSLGRLLLLSWNGWVDIHTLEQSCVGMAWVILMFENTPTGQGLGYWRNRHPDSEVFVANRNKL